MIRQQSDRSFRRCKVWPVLALVGPCATVQPQLWRFYCFIIYVKKEAAQCAFKMLREGNDFTPVDMAEHWGS